MIYIRQPQHFYVNMYHLLRYPFIALLSKIHYTKGKP